MLKPFTISQTVLVGLLAGYISGLLGLGGGIILVPAMVYLLKLPQRQAQGTALLVIVPTALIGASGYFLAGVLRLDYVVWVAAGAMLGVLIGSTIAHKLHPDLLRRLFGVIAVMVAIKMYLG